MSYPYGDTYLEQIQKNPNECKQIEQAFYVLRKKYIKDHPGYNDPIDLTLPEQFMLLGEAFELGSQTLNGVSDEYHFVWDIIEALLTPTEEKK